MRSCPPASMLKVNQEQDIIQINNNMKPLQWQRNSVGLVRAVKMLGAVDSPNVKTFH